MKNSPKRQLYPVQSVRSNGSRYKIKKGITEVIRIESLEWPKTNQKIPRRSYLNTTNANYAVCYTLMNISFLLCILGLFGSMPSFEDLENPVQPCNRKLSLRWCYFRVL
jgi:hypothetical protein